MHDIQFRFSTTTEWFVWRLKGMLQNTRGEEKLLLCKEQRMHTNLPNTKDLFHGLCCLR